MQLYRELRDGTWEPARLSCFVVTYPKAREIWASEFKDRVVQCVLYNRWREQFHNSFIYDTYACIAGRGALMGSHRGGQDDAASQPELPKRSVCA
jgi:RNA-directed DNA polymerase